MDEQQLNKKLAEWVGFKFEDFNPLLVTWKGEEGHDGISVSMHINGKYFAHEMMLNFTQSLDSCFKWLVPKLGWCDITFSQDTERSRGRSCHILRNKPAPFRIAASTELENSALALCLAVEKLIDGE